MKLSAGSHRWLLVLAGCGLVLVGAVPLVADATADSERTAADRYVDTLSRRIALQEEPCTGLAARPAGRRLCGRATVQPIVTAAHEIAMTLAEGGVPVLELRTSPSMSPYQFADLPAFKPPPESAQLFQRAAYVIGAQRVTVHYGPYAWRPPLMQSSSGRASARHNGELPMFVVFSIEPLGRPLPQVFPAVR